MGERLLLCCDTGTPVESVALVRGTEILAERAEQRGAGHGASLLDTVAAVLEAAGLTLADVDAFVCGVGPGSFTGLRISLATMKGLALALGKPLYGVRTVEAFRRALPGAPVIAVVDARRGEIFADGAGLSAPVCCRPERLGEHLRLEPGERVTLLGPGAVLYADALRAALPVADVPDDPVLHRVRAALLAPAVPSAPPPDFAALEPCYVRPSDAEINYPNGFPDATVAPKQKLPAKRRPGSMNAV